MDEYATSKPNKQSWSPEELLGGNKMHQNLEEATGGSLKIAPTLPELQSVEEQHPSDQKQPASSEGTEASRNKPSLGEEATASAGSMTTSDQEWLERLEEVHAYKTEHGTLPREEDNESLGKWFQEQLAANIDRTLAPDRRQVLGYFVISFTKPPATDNELRWDSMFESFCQFKEKNGHVRPTKSNCGGDKTLVTWVQTQRYLYKKRKLRPDRLVKLENLGMLWDRPAVHNEASWNSMYESLCQFKEKNGHVYPNNGNCCDNKQLVTWVYTQRSLYNKKNLRPDRLVKLENLGMMWDHNEASWNSMYESLCQFKEKNGHLHPDKGNCRDSKQLVTWVQKQRSLCNKKDLRPDRLVKLENLGMTWEDKNETRWNSMCERFCQLKEKNGDVRPRHGICDDNKQLVTWLKTQRSYHKKQKLRDDRLVKLESLGMVWSPESACRSNCSGTGTNKCLANDRCIATKHTGAEKFTFEGKRSAENALDDDSTNAIRKQRTVDVASLANMIHMTDGLLGGETRVSEQEHGVDMACPTSAKPASAENERRGSGKCPADSSSSKKQGACSELPTLPKPKLTGLYGLLENLVSSRRGQSAEHAALAEEPNSSDISATSALSSPESEDSAKRIKTKRQKLVTMKTGTNTTLDEQQTVRISRDSQHFDTNMAGRAETSEVWLAETVSVPKPSIGATEGGGSSHDPALNVSVSKMDLKATPPTHQCKKTNGKVPSAGTSEPIVRSSDTIKDRSNSAKRAVDSSYSTKPQKKHKVAFTH